MVYCIVQQALESGASILSLIYNLRNVSKEKSLTIVVCALKSLEDEIRNVGFPEDVTIDFHTAETLTLASMVSQWTTAVKYCLEKYGVVECLCEDLLLVRDIFALRTRNKDKAHIRFLKKNHPVPSEHYYKLLSTEYFYCDNINVFNQFAEQLANSHNELTSRIQSSIITDSSSNSTNSPQLTVADYLNGINKTNYKFIRELAGEDVDKWKAYEVNGCFVATEDLVGGINNQLNLSSIDFDLMKLKERFDIPPPEGSSLATKEEKISEETEIYGFLFRRFSKNEQAIRVNAFIAASLVKRIPDVLRFIRFKTRNGLDIVHPNSSYTSIGIWQRKDLPWHNALTSYFANLRQECCLLKEGKMEKQFRFSVGSMPIICEPSVEFLTPDLFDCPRIGIVNLTKNSKVISEIERLNLKYEFVGYIPTYSEELDTTTSAKLINDNLFMKDFSSVSSFIEATHLLDLQKVEMKQKKYEKYIDEILENHFIYISHNDCDRLESIGNVIAEAMACGRPLLLEESITLFGLEEGKHYLRGNTKLMSKKEYDLLSKNCRSYYELNIRQSQMAKNLICSLLKFNIVENE